MIPAKVATVSNPRRAARKLIRECGDLDRAEAKAKRLARNNPHRADYKAIHEALVLMSNCDFVREHEPYNRGKLFGPDDLAELFYARPRKHDCAPSTGTLPLGARLAA